MSVDKEPKDLAPAQRETVAEIRTLARTLADKYAEYVVFLAKYMEKSLEDALKDTCAKPPRYIERVLSESPRQLSWFSLNNLEVHTRVFGVPLESCQMIYGIRRVK